MKAVENNDLVIVGGGITGLSAAYLAAREGKKVTVIEGSKSFGGLLNTFEIGNNRLEFYYHHFFTHDAEINWLINELGIANKLFFKKTSMGVFKSGKIYDFNSPIDLLKFKPISFIDKIKFGLTSIYLGKVAKWENFEHVSCLEWFKKWAGQSSTSSLWAPLLNIKFGPFASKVPLTWMIGRLRQRMSSKKNGDEQLGYLDGSLQVLLDALLARLKSMGVQLVANAPVQKINFTNNHITGIDTATGSYKGQDYLFTIPTIYLSKLLKQDRPQLAGELDKIEYFGAICVVLELNRSLSDIYWLNVAEEGFPFGGVIEHTNFIGTDKYNGSHIAYLSRYFAMSEEIATMDDAAIKGLMLQYLPKIYNDFDVAWVKNISVFKTNTAATVCDLNFSEKVPDCKTNVENMFIASMSHIYPDERSTNNSIRIAAEACRVMGMDTAYVPKNSSLSGKIGF